MILIFRNIYSRVWKIEKKKDRNIFITRDVLDVNDCFRSDCDTIGIENYSLEPYLVVIIYYLLSIIFFGIPFPY